MEVAFLAMPVEKDKFEEVPKSNSKTLCVHRTLWQLDSLSLYLLLQLLYLHDSISSAVAMASRLLTPLPPALSQSFEIRPSLRYCRPVHNVYTVRRHELRTSNPLTGGSGPLKRRMNLVESCRISCPRQTEDSRTVVCRAKEGEDTEVVAEEIDGPLKSVKQVALWVMAGVYTSYLFFLPYAPGDPVWAISPATITGVLDLSFNFFYVLPLLNLLGFHLLEAAAVHPTDEALFNFVLGWALLFAPLIFTDRKRDRFPGSLDVFWLASMFLTNTFLIPYMAIRLQGSSKSQKPLERTSLQRAFTGERGARWVAATGAAVGLLSIVWFAFGRSGEGYGDLSDRWSYWVDTLSKDRPTYAFIWDLCCYTVFQPWLVGDNLENVRADRKDLVKKLMFVPYVGLIVYCWSLERSKTVKSE